MMKCVFFCTEIRGTQKGLMGLGAHFLYRVASKPYNEYGNVYIENLFTPINMALTASICTKPTITQRSLYTEVYTNLTKNLECTGKIPFAPLNYLWLSLNRFLQNS